MVCQHLKICTTCANLPQKGLLEVLSLRRWKVKLSTTLANAFEVWTLVWPTVLHILLWRLQHLSFYDIYVGSLISGKLYLYYLRFGTGNLPGDQSYQRHQISGQASKYEILEHVDKSAFKPRGFANVVMALPKFCLAHIQLTHLSGQTYPSNDYLFQYWFKVVNTCLGELKWDWHSINTYSYGKVRSTS